MPTFETTVQNNQILFNVCVGVNINEDRFVYPALFDTGAQKTMISEKVVTDLKLQSIGEEDITGISGIAKTEIYMIRLDIPIDQRVVLEDGEIGMHTSLFGKQLSVAKLPFRHNGWDVLIGMDIIVINHITMHGNKFILSH